MSWIYIIGVIVFAIVSNVNKAKKGSDKKKQAPRGSMPTFGGEGKDVFSKVRGYMQPEGAERKPEVQGSGFPVPGNLQSQPQVRSFSSPVESGYDASPAFPESALFPSPDYETGEGSSMEQPGGESLETRIKDMDRELNRLHSAFNQISATDDSNGNSPAYTTRETNVSDKQTAVQSKQLQNGLIWAEILSPPRSKRPFNSRREG
ncbi:hypothetical protein [Paenibacillus wynnii]|uniref:Uncharacterized protein n=1 Tax=Paenibacillus wynnii TaxID=268407 RepID=A0A098M6G2_9BACL|nr:hypothetical protein [Paenibacillus wynnii]KGE18165.1 hypothetical protein PWYN_26910 [Paenibacillus wynnii]